MYHNNKLYIAFFKAFSRCHKDDSQKTNQVRANELWKTIRKKNENTNVIEVDMDLYRAVLQDLNQKSEEKEEKKKISRFFRGPTTKKVNPVGHNPEKEPKETEDGSCKTIEKEKAADDDNEEEIATQKPTPAQEKLENEIKTIDLQLGNLREAKAISNTDESAASLTKIIKTLKQEKDDLEKKLKKKKQDQIIQMNWRKKGKIILKSSRKSIRKLPQN